MKHLKLVVLLVFFIGLASNGFAGKGYMGGSGTLTQPGAGSQGGETPTDSAPSTPTTDGPLNDKMSEAGKLFGDLYVIARYLGGGTKNVPAFDGDVPVMVSVPWTDPSDPKVPPVPVLVDRQEWTKATAVGGEPKLTEEFAVYQVLDENGDPEINPLTGGTYFPAPYPSQCVQPVADFARWGDISEKTGLSENRLPLVITYDPTWERSECAVKDEVFLAAGEDWHGVTYYKEIRYPDLIQEVDFGRLNLGRAPDAVLDHAFDEAIRSLNKAKSIALDAAGRLLLTTDVYDPYLTDEDGSPVLLETVTKAIDSPLENLALYIKLMKDGHLITPVVERTAIDRSLHGGIPLANLVEIEDGPSKVLRPTIDVLKMQAMGLGNLVDASNIKTYYTYSDAEGGLIVGDGSCPQVLDCEESYGITELTSSDVCAGPDFPFSATFFAAAADKSGKINMDKIVYLNSILGINRVVGYSAYEEDGTPTSGAIDYSKYPVYFNYATHMTTAYDRGPTFIQRGQVVTAPGGGTAASYDGLVRVLVLDPTSTETSRKWLEQTKAIFPTVFGTLASPDGEPYSGSDITGFTTMADDDLRTIEYIHTYQIPSLR